MKINKIMIQDYGPIRDLVIEPAECELIFGFNETGKTAFVEAITYALFKKTKLRYSKPVNIEIEIKDKTSRKYKFPSKKDIMELPTGDIANLLYIKASDSTLHPDRSETSFWDSIMGLMNSTGDRIPLIKLIDKIYNNVGITPKKEEWQDEKKRLIASEEQRKKNIAQYLDQIGNIENEEKDLAILVEKQQRIKTAIDEIEQHKKYLFFRRTSDLYEEDRRDKSGLQDYERYKYDYQSEWQKLNIEKQNTQKNSKKIKDIENELELLKKEIEELKDKQKQIDTAGILSADISKSSPAIPYWLISLCVFFGTAIMFILSLFFPPLRSIAGVMALIGLLTAGFLLHKQHRHTRSRLVREQILDQAQQIFPDLKTIADLHNRIKTIDDEVKIKTARHEEKNRNKQDFAQGENINDIETRIKDLRDKTGLAELTDFDLKIKEKRIRDDKLSRLRAQLEEKLHEKDELQWPACINALEVRSVKIKPDPALEPELRHELENTSAQIAKFDHDIRIFRELTQKQYRISDHRQAFLEFEQLNKRLDNYDLEKNAAVIIKKILTEMSTEMEDFIAGIFNGPDSLSDLFYFITEKYNRIQLENKKFTAYDRDNRSYDVDTLSSGTRDQLLLCFRLATIKKIYPAGCFMLLDDAFIFADWPRRQRLPSLF